MGRSGGVLGKRTGRKKDRAGTIHGRGREEEERVMEKSVRGLDPALDFVDPRNTLDCTRCVLGMFGVLITSPIAPIIEGRRLICMSVPSLRQPSSNNTQFIKLSIVVSKPSSHHYKARYPQARQTQGYSQPQAEPLTTENPTSEKPQTEPRKPL
ncbi:hypothetical protein ARMGADRAFT_1037888 [Armillaria gallica]|uniref:Uncharacterized protein n=1 Tax=Armillaria gallica TaxID=47427 RepID=A0A2H3CWF3_ARMGA|nr:hypothetical protein ARMGADRAFT_1037888 [Armillaria gallica]